MTLVYLLSIPFLLLGYVIGGRYIQLYSATIRKTLQLLSFFIAIYVVAMLLFVYGILSEALAGTLMSLFYAFLSGLAMGKLHSQLEIKKSAGYPLYNYKNPVILYTPLVIGSTLIIAGLLRIGWAFDVVITPIRLFSGASLVLFGLVSFTLYITPHLKTQSVLLIDQAINWKTFLDYQWLGEDEIQMVFKKEDESANTSGHLNIVMTIQVNPGERVIIERILAMKKDALNDLDGQDMQ